MLIVSTSPKKGYLKDLEKGIRIWEIRVAVLFWITGDSYQREGVFGKKEKCELSQIGVKAEHRTVNIPV